MCSSSGGEDDGQGDEELLMLKRTVVNVTAPDGGVSQLSIPCDAAFVAIGHDPNTGLFKEQQAPLSITLTLTLLVPLALTLTLASSRSSKRHYP